MDCLFCQIAAGEIPCRKVYEDDTMLAFYDIAPKAPTHILLIPKCHIGGADELTEENAGVVAHIFAQIPKIAAAQGLSSYRVLTNTGVDAGQTVRHLHFHLLGGRVLGELG